jgi:hypothetical protein
MQGLANQICVVDKERKGSTEKLMLCKENEPATLGDMLSIVENPQLQRIFRSFELAKLTGTR